VANRTVAPRGPGGWDFVFKIQLGEFVSTPDRAGRRRRPTIQDRVAKIRLSPSPPTVTRNAAKNPKWGAAVEGFLGAALLFELPSSPQPAYPRGPNVPVLRDRLFRFDCLDPAETTDG
jgi:hypothetical protein